MDTNNASGYWIVKKEKIKQKYAILTDEDLHFCEGKEKEMIEIITSVDPNYVQDKVNEIISKNQGWSLHGDLIVSCPYGYTMFEKPIYTQVLRKAPFTK